MCYLKFPHLLSSQFEAYVDEDPLIDRFNSHRIVLSINWQAARMLHQLYFVLQVRLFMQSPPSCLHSIFRRQGHHSVICLGFQHQKSFSCIQKLNTKESYCLEIIVERNCTTVSTIILSLNLLFFISKCAVSNCLERASPLSIIVLAPFLLSQKQLIAIITIGIFNEAGLF